MTIRRRGTSQRARGLLFLAVLSLLFSTSGQAASADGRRSVEHYRPPRGRALPEKAAPAPALAAPAGPTVLLETFSLDDGSPNGDGDAAPEPGEHPLLDVTLANPGAAPATGVAATLSASTAGVVVTQPTSIFGDLAPGASAAAATPYQISIDPSLPCLARCPAIHTTLYGVDAVGVGTIQTFAFDTDVASAVATPGEFPSGGPDGLAAASATDAFWVNGFGLDLIHEFDPTTGALIPGPFPVSSPGSQFCTDGLAMVAPGRLFTQNFCDDTLYEIDTATGLTVNALPTGLGVVGSLAGGNGRLFATRDYTTIAEIDPDTGSLLSSFPAPDVNGDGLPDSIYGLGFDGTYVFAASIDTEPPNVAALDPATGALIAVSPYAAPFGYLSALDAVAGPPGRACIPGRPHRTAIDLDLSITTDQGPFAASFSLPLGTDVLRAAFHDDVEGGVNGWSAAGAWHRTTDRSASPSHSWYFGTENGPGLGDNAYDNDSAGTLTSPIFDLSDATSATLVFDHYLDRELGFDAATVSVSTDGFGTSRLLAALGPALDPAFQRVDLDLSAVAGSPTLQVRFTFTSDSSGVREGWYVDNVRIAATTVACGVLGDCLANDGAIDIFDVLHQIDILLGRVSPTPAEAILCDDNCDTEIDIFDVLREIDAILGRIPQPLTCPGR